MTDQTPASPTGAFVRDGITVLGIVAEGAYGEPDLTLDGLPISRAATIRDQSSPPSSPRPGAASVTA